MNRDQQPPKPNPTLAFSLVFYLILAGHFAVDAYSALVPAVLTKLELHFSMRQNQSAWLLAAGSFSSGISQPIFGWLSKKLNTVAFVGIGILFAALCIPTISMLDQSHRLYGHYVLGMIGVGIFHPVGASSIGAINPDRRSAAVSCFFVAGMAGGITGSLVGPALMTYQWNFFQPITIGKIMIPQFAWLAIPGILISLPAYLAARSIHLRQASPQSMIDSTNPGEPEITVGASRQNRSTDWEHNAKRQGTRASLAFLYFASAIRFFVNMALVFLMVRFAAEYFSGQSASGAIDSNEVSDFSSRLAGRFQAFMISGMALGGLAAGFLIPMGRERLPLILIPILFAPIVIAIPYADPIWICPVLFVFTGAGFASMVPVSISLAQRLLPENTGLASGMMMGGAWAFAMLGPPFAGLVLKNLGMESAFLVIALILASAGLLIIPAKKIGQF